MLGLPLVNDQFFIKAKLPKEEAALRIEWDDINDEYLLTALNTVLDDARQIILWLSHCLNNLVLMIIFNLDLDISKMQIGYLDTYTMSWYLAKRGQSTS